MTRIKSFFFKYGASKKTGLFWLGTDHTSPKWIKVSKTEFHLYSESGQRQQVLARIPPGISYEKPVPGVLGAKSGFCWCLDIQFCRMEVKSPAVSFICIFFSRANSSNRPVSGSKGILEIKAFFVPHTGRPLIMLK